MERPIPKPSASGLSGTGGAVPVRNEKGELTMQKVKVQRYVAGQRPKYAPSSDNEEEMYEQSGDEQEEEKSQQTTSRRAHQPDQNLINKNTAEDRRLRRLNEIDNTDTTEVVRERARHRHIAEPVILEEQDDDDNAMATEDTIKKEESDDEEMDNEERMKRRLELKRKALQRQEELLALEEDQNQESGDDSDSDESEYEDEEYSDSEDEIAPRLKPVFVKKTDRVTIKQKEMELEQEKEVERERERLHLESKKQTKKIIEEEILREKLAEKETDENVKCDFQTDDDEEDNEQNYELWKLRELKRTKRYRDEKENAEKEKQEIQRMRNMTEEERLAYLRANPKQITNASDKGKYKFMQKYYHRGAFYLDKEDDVLKRNVAEPTLEDHFDKTILPKVMQVKNFGMAGRTKYTHLLDQDTTRADDNPWSNQEKFISGKGGGTKQVFDKPTAKKRK